ncbi:MAG: AI-2E family transporter [Verrucomicrobiota bacterium]
MPATETRNPTRRLERRLAGALLFLLLVGSFVVLRPFLTALLWGVVLAFALWPVQVRLLRWFGGRRTPAALANTLLLALVLVGPFVLLGMNLVDDARALGAAARKTIREGPPPPPAWLEKMPAVGGPAVRYWREFAADLVRLGEALSVRLAAEEAATGGGSAPGPETGEGSREGMGTETGAVPGAGTGGEAPGGTGGRPAAAGSLGESRLVQWATQGLVAIRSRLMDAGLALGRGVMEFVLSVVLTFFVFRDGAEVAARLRAGLVRIAGDRAHRLLEVAGNTVRGVVYGILGTALVQASMAGLGYAIAGVPGAALLGLATFFLSVVPVGPPMLWVPAAFWLFQHEGTGWAVFMLGWGFGVSSIDNVVKPWLISQGSNLPFLVTFFGVIGGALAFGLIGVFLGPTVVAVTYRLIDEWSAPPDGEVRS